MRAGLAVVAVLLGLLSMTRSAADVVKRSDPGRAHALAPGNGRITALLAERRLGERPVAGAQASIVRMATLALLQDPIAVPAVATLGFQAQLGGDVAHARRLFAYSQMLSRRHLPTQLWAIEEAVARSDVPKTLQNYDLALRTSKAAPELLFPVLAEAITDPSIRSSLQLTMSKRPAWGPGFITYASTTRNDPRATASLFAGLRRAGVQVPLGASARVIDRLIETGYADVAWRYYKTVHPHADPRRSRDPEFKGDFKAPSQFDWIPVDDETTSTSIQGAEHGGVFDFAVPTGLGGPLLRQRQMLTPGAYILRGRSAGIQQPSQSLPYWEVTCGSGREVGRVIVPNSADNGGAFVGRLDIPVGCATQILALVARPSEQMTGLTGQIERVQLSPISPDTAWHRQ